MRRETGRAWIALTLSLLTARCGGEGGRGGGAGWDGSVDTLSTGVVRVTNPARGLWGEEERWRLETDLRIGSLDSGGPDQLGSVADLAVDESGRIYVLERQAREVRVFGPEGSWLRTFGSQGSGPGELEAPNSLEWGPRGHLWIADFRNRRFEVFDTTGTRVGSHPVEGMGFGFGSRWGPDSLLYDFVSVREGDRISRRVIRKRLEVGEGDAQLVTTDTLRVPELPEAETVEINLTQGGRRLRMFVPVPLQPMAREELVPGRGWWLSDPGSEYRLARVDLGGDTSLIVERRYESVPVTPEAREEALESLPEGADLDPDRIPDVHPPLSGMEAAPRGGLWVRRQTAPDREGYDLFDPQGRYLGEVATDVALDRFTLEVLGEDALYGVLLDELDVPYVVRLRVVRPSPSP